MTRKPIGISVPYRKVAPMFTQKEIHEMSKESGVDIYGLGATREKFLDRLEAFAKLAVARAKEKNK